MESIVRCGLMTEGHDALYREIYKLCTKIIMVHFVSFSQFIIFVYVCANSVSTRSSQTLTILFLRENKNVHAYVISNQWREMVKEIEDERRSW